MGRVTKYLTVGLLFVFSISVSAQVYEAWVARYFGPGDYDDVANAIVVDDSGNVYVTGSSWAGPTGRDYTTIKYSTSGDTVWVWS